MFTGIITDIGRVRAIEQQGDRLISIETDYDTGTIKIGDSVACDGVCLTVVDKGDNWFAVNASGETLSCTNLGGWHEGSHINLERSLRVGDEMGGHMMLGHVDGVSEILAITPEGGSVRIELGLPENLGAFIAPKGSLAMNGVSLTVNEVGKSAFGVNIIPHTLAHTNFNELKPGDQVNVEVDVLARYVARLIERE